MLKYVHSTIVAGRSCILWEWSKNNFTIEVNDEKIDVVCKKDIALKIMYRMAKEHEEKHSTKSY